MGSAFARNIPLHSPHRRFGRRNRVHDCDDSGSESCRALGYESDGVLEDELEPTDGRPSVFVSPATESITAMSWNVAAVNNNPFEYWITYRDSSYWTLMQGVEYLLEDPPAEHDMEVRQIFTEGMFQELKQQCAREGMLGLDDLESIMWSSSGELHLSTRRVISEFIKDKTLGAKRLISMPDRITNTIHVVTRAETLYRPPPVCRPSVINNYQGDLSTTEVWWDAWKTFMFENPLTVRVKGGIAVQRPVDMLDPIPRNKYPAVTEDEERLAIPLQILCQAIFDGIIVHLMNTLAPNGEWQVVKGKIYEKLYKMKHVNTMNIIANVYGTVDIVCLQEVAAVFADTFRDSPMARTHMLVMPARLDGKRDQNSFIILRHNTFMAETVREVTPVVLECFRGELKAADGDVIVLEAMSRRDGRMYLIASFHGDTSGQLSTPMMQAIHEAMQWNFPGHLLVLAMDANVTVDKPGSKLFSDFCSDAVAVGLTTCWGDCPDGSKCRTTCNARTSLQPQLNKAIRCADIIKLADKSPKDLILFYKNQLQVLSEEEMGPERQRNPVKDNTGRLRYKEDSVFPTLDFPSDHGIVALALRPTNDASTPSLPRRLA